MTVRYESRNLSTNFPIKIEPISIMQKTNLVYYRKYPNRTWSEEYITEDDKRVKERIIEHNKRGKNSHVLRHLRGERYSRRWEEYFKEYFKNVKY